MSKPNAIIESMWALRNAKKNGARRKVVGDGEIVFEQVVNEVAFKHHTIKTIRVTTAKSIVLECGHQIPKSHFNKAPTMNTWCMECGESID